MENLKSFDIWFLHQVSKGLMSHEELNETIKDLVNKVLIEQYTNKDGDFEFALTKLGRETGGFITDAKNREDEDS